MIYSPVLLTLKRLYNAGFGIYRLTVEDFTFEGYHVPKNSKVFIFCGRVQIFPSSYRQDTTTIM
jgi:hypothetical protein